MSDVIGKWPGRGCLFALRGSTLLVVAASTWIASACAGSTSAPKTADPLASDLTPFEQTPAESGDPTPLPRYFSIELNTDGTHVLGQPVDDAELKQTAAREAHDTRNLGAAIAITDAVPREQVIALIDVLLGAGFAHIVLSSREGMVTRIAAAEPLHGVAAEPELPTPATPVDVDLAEPPAESPVAEEPAVPTNVEVKQLGLHIGGGPNTEQAQAAYSGPISERFDDFARCYPMAQGARGNASFGVDLLISSNGGTAKIKDYRTALGGKDFHLCVLGVFGTIEFPRPERATVVSYSLLFKPL